MVSPSEMLAPKRAKKTPQAVVPADVARQRSRRRVKPLTVTVLMGGPSSEREVSLASGEAVAKALESLGHKVWRSDIDPDNLAALDRPADLVFIALHGAFGEDGKLQRILDARGIRYVGSGPTASEQAMDKLATKRLLAAEGIDSPAYTYVERKGVRTQCGCYRVPAVVKPVDSGSSVDTVIAHHSLELLNAVHRLMRKYGRCLVEEFISGPELTVGVLGDDALGPIEIRARHGFYDYQAKYLDDNTEYHFKIDLPGALLEQVRADSLRVHRLLGCRDFSRVDWMIDRHRGRAYCLEANTIPGFTSHSLLPKMAAEAGLDFPAFCQRIVDLAMQRQD
jgi:D-alanine-D-alanine ligase